jgi:hypothetical protein
VSLMVTLAWDFRDILTKYIEENAMDTVVSE